MMCENKDKKEKGTRILQNFKKKVINHPALRETFNESKKGTVFMYGLDYKDNKKSNE